MSSSLHVTSSTFLLLLLLLTCGCVDATRRQWYLYEHACVVGLPPLDNLELVIADIHCFDTSVDKDSDGRLSSLMEEIRTRHKHQKFIECSELARLVYYPPSPPYYTYTGEDKKNFTPYAERLLEFIFERVCSDSDSIAIGPLEYKGEPLWSSQQRAQVLIEFIYWSASHGLFPENVAEFVFNACHVIHTADSISEVTVHRYSLVDTVCSSGAWMTRRFRRE
jgi:hypothetical protein